MLLHWTRRLDAWWQFQWRMGSGMLQITLAKTLECPEDGYNKPSHMIINWVPIKGENC